MAVELADPRRALEVFPCDLRLPCRGRWLALVVVGVGCLGLSFTQRCLAAEAHLLYVLKGLACTLKVEEEVGGDLAQHPDVLLGRSRSRRAWLQDFSSYEKGTFNPYKLRAVMHGSATKHPARFRYLLDPPCVWINAARRRGDIDMCAE